MFQFSDELDSVTDTRLASRRATRLLMEAHRSSPAMSPPAMKAFRRGVMAARYRALPSQLLDTFVDTFHGDFALFDYHPRPQDIII